MNERTSTDTTGLEAAVANLSVAWEKLLAAYRFYPDGHQSLVDFQKKFASALSRLNARSEPAAFKVTPVGLIYDRFMMLESESAKTSLTRPLFLEGVQAFRFAPSVTMEETNKLTWMWNKALLRQMPKEHTFSSWCWEAGFTGVEVVIIDSLASLTSQEQEDLRLLGEQANVLAERVVRKENRTLPKPTISAAARKSFLQAEAGVELGDGTGTGTMRGWDGLSVHELASLRTEFHRVLPDGMERGVDLVIRLLPMATDAERPVVTGWGNDIMDTIAQRPEALPLLRIIKDMGRISQSAGGEAPYARHVLSQFLGNGGAVQTRLLAALDSKEDRVLAYRVLDELPVETLGQWLKLIPLLPAGDSRTRLATQLAKRKAPVEQLVALIPRLTQEDLVWLNHFRLAADVGPQIQKALATHPVTSVRLAALNAMEPWELPPRAPQLVELLRDSKPEVQGAAMRLIAHGQVSGAGPAVGDMLLGKPIEAVALQLMSLLVHINRAEAARVLPLFFAAEKNTYMRVRCAEYLADVGKADCLPLLLEHTKGLFTPGKLKVACKAAADKISARGG